MWPFSTIRRLRMELQQANRSDEMIRAALERATNALVAARDETSTVRGDLLAAENKARVLSGELLTAQHARDAAQSLNRSLAAERDEAVLRARRLDKLTTSDLAEIARLQQALHGAIVRGPKGRMVKWADLNAATPLHDTGVMEVG